MSTDATHPSPFTTGFHPSPHFPTYTPAVDHSRSIEAPARCRHSRANIPWVPGSRSLCHVGCRRVPDGCLRHWVWAPAPIRRQVAPPSHLPRAHKSPPSIFMSTGQPDVGLQSQGRVRSEPGTPPPQPCEPSSQTLSSASQPGSWAPTTPCLGTVLACLLPTSAR